ncbi:hypothetical protein ABPG77_011282 [Micractinium sp. CCAP 211/92]
MSWCKKTKEWLCLLLGRPALRAPIGAPATPALLRSVMPPRCGPQSLSPLRKFGPSGVTTLLGQLLQGMKAAKRQPSLQGPAPSEAAKLLDAKPPATCLSALQEERLAFRPQLPSVLAGPHNVVEGEQRQCLASYASVCASFPHLAGAHDSSGGALRIMHLVPGPPAGPHDGGATKGAPLRLGVLFSGGQASGGHNVIIGLHDYLQRWHPGSTLLGFLNGPRGVMQNNHKVLTPEELDSYRNQGGFHLIGSGRDKIESVEQLAAADKTCADERLDGIVIIGGDDSNTNAAIMAEHFLARGVKTRVVGVPKTIDGDLKNADVPCSFGFDTACKVFSESVGNICIDAASAKKYYHFIRLMGRAASHITLECALQTHPQMAIISEEVAAHRWGFKELVNQIADVVVQRAEQGMNYGVILIPEGLIEHMNDVSTLIAELNELLAQGLDDSDEAIVSAHLTPESAELFNSVPLSIRREIREERDPHGNVQVSHIETEKLVVKQVEAELTRRMVRGQYSGKFAAITHFFGYEGRCSLPSIFDATYCNALGHAAGALVAAGQTGLMATVSNLQCPPSDWAVGGTPLLAMMHLERRLGRDKPVIEKALVDLGGPAMRAFSAARSSWAAGDYYRVPGPIQYQGCDADRITLTLELELSAGKPAPRAAEPATNGAGSPTQEV